MTEKLHPLNEVSLALQVGDTADFGASEAFAAHARLREDYPLIDAVGRIDALGDSPGISLRAATEPEIRWWLSSRSGDHLVQFQENLAAFNWRRRPIEADDARPYPGYEFMLAELSKQIEIWRELTHRTELLPNAAQLLYDNIWPIEPETKVADIFTFWKTLGVQARQLGPRLTWSLLLDDGALGPNGRIDIDASLGQGEFEGRPQRAARLQLTAYAFPDEPETVKDLFDTLHAHVHRVFNLLVTDECKRRF